MESVWNLPYFLCAYLSFYKDGETIHFTTNYDKEENLFSRVGVIRMACHLVILELVLLMKKTETFSS
jgi:hypothetical protein